MKLLDANVLLRWLLGDDKRQSEAVDRFLRDAFHHRHALFVPDLVVAEMVWVMEGLELNSQDIAKTVRVMLNEGRITFENRERLLSAITLYDAHAVDFVDAYQASVVQERQLEGIVSFDRDFDRLPVFRLEP